MASIGDPELGGFRPLSSADPTFPPIKYIDTSPPPPPLPPPGESAKINHRPEEARKQARVGASERAGIVAGVKRTMPTATMICTRTGCIQSTNGARWHCANPEKAEKHMREKPGHHVVLIADFLKG